MIHPVDAFFLLHNVRFRRTCLISIGNQGSESSQTTVQLFHGRVWIGKRLEIRDEPGSRRLITRLAGRNLLLNGRQDTPLTQLRSPPVAVGTGKTGVDLQLVDRAAEPVAPVAFQIVIAFGVFPEIRFIQCRLGFIWCFYRASRNHDS
jgi:hypothetical protein